MGTPNFIEDIALELGKELKRPGSGGRFIIVFVIAAAALDRPELCGRAIAASQKAKWGQPPPGETGGPLVHGVPGAHILDITAMSTETLSEIPPRYLASLGRAFRLRDNKEGYLANPKVYAAEFLRLMAL